MATPISALAREPSQLVREVSPEAINFYVDELSGIYLPDDFKQKYADVRDVERWGVEDRLHGKFGRFAVRHLEESDEKKPMNGILLMGTTIGLSGLDRDGYMASLRHYGINEKVRKILRERDLPDRITVDRADYGSTSIKLGDDGAVEAVSVSGSSYDFGRATAEGRQETCDMFAELLGVGIQVINSDPDPKDFDRIVR